MERLWKAGFLVMVLALSCSMTVTHIARASSSLYEGKRVSIIGDSLSTYEGWILNGYETLYPIYDVNDVSDTWWKMFIDAERAELEVNASYSGTRVTTFSRPNLYQRASLIGNPDLIIIALGTCDSFANISLGEYDFQTDYTSLSEREFRPAYIKGVKALQTLHPNAKLLCLIMAMEDAYRDSIVHIANTLDIAWVECRNYTKYHNDTIHPGIPGMRQIASHLTDLIKPERTISFTVSTEDRFSFPFKTVSISANGVAHVDTNGTVSFTKIGNGTIRVETETEVLRYHVTVEDMPALYVDVPEIQDGAFSGSGAMRIVLGPKVAFIGNGAFSDMDNLLIVCVEGYPELESDTFQNVKQLLFLAPENSQVSEFADNNKDLFMIVR